MVSLRHELRADDDVEFSLGDVVELLPQAFHRFNKIARQHQQAAAGEQLRHFFAQPLHARADRRETILGLAFRAFGRRRQRIAAVMADEPPPEAMIDQPGVAIRAMQAKAAGAAERERRIAAPVEKKERLLAALERDLHRLRQPRRDEAPARGAFAF